MTMTTEKLIEAIATAKSRGDVVSSYAAGIRVGADTLSPVHWPTVNRVIITRWSMAGLKFIKGRAWKLVGTAKV